MIFCHKFLELCPDISPIIPIIHILKIVWFVLFADKANERENTSKHTTNHDPKVNTLLSKPSFQLVKVCVVSPPHIHAFSFSVK